MDRAICLYYLEIKFLCSIQLYIHFFFLFNTLVDMVDEFVYNVVMFMVHLCVALLVFKLKNEWCVIGNVICFLLLH